MREARRAKIVSAFARVLADHGYAGATIVAVADEAGVAPGLIHHHFDDKQDLLSALLELLLRKFRGRVRQNKSSGDLLEDYINGTLRLDSNADTTAARCWVGLFAEAVRNPEFFKKIRKLVDGEISAIQKRSANRLSVQDAGAVLAFVVGSLVLGAFAPKKTAGFAAPGLRRFVAALMSRA
ncbi:MAG: TetR family transcriptional regulator [Deltaproteobacteria bacterium]|nr:TetR family transcriptional regulator [Deltaproteobacteria bacterium]